jgi:molybdopterin converting factor small subunit
MEDMARVRYWAGARAAAHIDEETVDAETLSDVLTAVRNEHGTPMTRLLGISVLLVDGVKVAAQDDVVVGPDTLIEILPPYAGGAQ